jgi:hypothetical protein
MKNESKKHLYDMPYEFWRTNQNLQKNLIMYDKTLAQNTSMEEAVFVSRFIWHYEKFRRVNNDWVFIQPQIFTRPLGMSVYTFRKIAKKWEELGLVETKCKGIPLKKWYRLNTNKLAEYLSEIYNKKARNQSCRNEQENTLKAGSSIKNIDIRESSDEDSKKQPSCGRQNAAAQECVLNNSSSPTLFNPNPPKKKSFSAIMSKKLWSKVSSKNQLPCNSKNRSAWSATFTRMMKEDEGRTKERVRRVLLWYIDHYGEDHIPEARCANTFRKKFCEIESAMNRWLKQNGQDTKDSDSPTVTRRVINTRIMD